MLIFGSLLTTAKATGETCQTFEFNLRLRFEETIVFTGASPCFALATLTAKGSAAHLGEVSVASQDCVNVKGAFDAGAPGSNSFVFTNHLGPVRITTATGDQLFMTYSGSLSARDDGPHRIRGHFVITGGTGRFAHAVGGGTLAGHEDTIQVVFGRGVIVATGSISY
ncbi:MAG TPA: hypothetical protein VF169_10935 [Albitalea sp.]|uniref:hypothetical protein n=1 Tax=Piscinibacter sp. TaxID=1903157 RepID=UPI002ED3A43E